MKRLIIITLFLCSIVQAQENSQTPPGTIKVSDSLFIDKIPVTNKMYIKFMNSFAFQVDEIMLSIILDNKGLNYPFYSKLKDDSVRRKMFRKVLFLEFHQIKLNFFVNGGQMRKTYLLNIMMC